MKLTMFQTPLAERAVGAAAAAVFLAGIVSAGLIDTEGGPMGPALAAPASTDAATSHGSTVDQVALPPVPSPSRVKPRLGTSAGGTTARGDAAPASSGGTGSPTHPGTPASPPGTPSASNPPPVEAGSDPTPSIDVEVGQVAVGVSPSGPEVSVDNPSDGVTVQVDTGVIAPIVLHLP